MKSASPGADAFVLSCAFLLAAASAAIGNAEELDLPRGEPPGIAAGPAAGFILILPQATEVLLTPSPVAERGDGPRLPMLAGELRFAVESPLPDWSVQIEVAPPQGREGPLPVARLQLRLESAGTCTWSSEGPTLLLSGHGPAPVSDLCLHLELRPDWQDAPGVYATELRLLPMLPPVSLEAGALPSRHDAEPRLPGVPVLLPVRGEIRETVLVSAAEGNYSLQGAMGLGRYTLVPDIPILIAANTERWEVRLEGSPFRCAEAEVPLARVSWAWVGPDGRPGDWTSLGESNLVLTGGQGRGVVARSLRLSLDVNLTDRAGDYRSQIRLAGAVGD